MTQLRLWKIYVRKVAFPILATFSFACHLEISQLHMDSALTQLIHAIKTRFENIRENGCLRYVRCASRFCKRRFSVLRCLLPFFV